MSARLQRRVVCLALAAVGLWTVPIRAQDITAEEVLDSIERGKGYLLRTQKADGSWTEIPNYQGGVTSLAVLALIHAGVSPQHRSIQKALEYLREIPPKKTYVVSLQAMAFIAASPVEDLQRIRDNVNWLQRNQIKSGHGAGMWGYDTGSLGGGDNSNTQFALLALREAAEIGIEIDPAVWRLAREHWQSDQHPSGGWGYRGMGPSGSMTVAGIASMVITGSQVHEGKEQIDRDGHIHGCGQYDRDNTLERGIQWLGRNFQIHTNPGRGDGLLYYLYGLERAGRLTGRRFFGEHDWYKEGAALLVKQGQNRLTGSWTGSGYVEEFPDLATSYCLLFLSKGKNPVVINKLKFGTGDDWNNDRDDIRHLMEFLSKHWQRPLHRPLSWQVVDIRAASRDDLLQAPIVYLNGHEAPELSDADLQKLRAYVAEGGYIFAEACCGRREFDAGFRALFKRMYPEPEYELKPLPPEHRIWDAEFRLDPASTGPLFGMDYGCRTAVIYSPQDLSCFWEQSSVIARKKSPHLDPMVEKALAVGTNVVAYATGLEFVDKLTPHESLPSGVPLPTGTRGLLQMAKLRHAGGSEAAPRALRNLLIALQRFEYGGQRLPGMQVDANPPQITPTDPQLFHYPIVYMHGNSGFRFRDAEVKQMREYFRRGGVLFADACCGSEPFQRSFVELCKQLFPDQPLERIPPDHPMFASSDAGGVWFDLKQVRRREPQRTDPTGPLRIVETLGEPYLEGIMHEGRYVIIYSPYDISCALERSGSVDCRGYAHEDALRIAVNVVIYATHY